MNNLRNESEILYKGRLLTEADLQTLSKEDSQWLKYYISLPPDSQQMISYEPGQLKSIRLGLSKAANEDAIEIQPAGKEPDAPQIYDNNGKPLLNEDYWEMNQNYANCYEYAMNVISVEEFDFLNPGELAGQKISSSTSPQSIGEYAIQDAQNGKLGDITQIEKCDSPDAKVTNTQYKVALAVAFVKNGNDEDMLLDYHWYKENPEGWSHKPGGFSILTVDGDGKKINKDNPPHKCRRVFNNCEYTEFVGYFIVTHN